MVGCGSPPPRIVAPLERIRARRGKKKFLFSKERGKPRSLSRPGVRCSGSRPGVEQLDADRHGPVLDEAPQVDQQLARQRDDHRLAHPARSIGGARLEPFGQRAFLLEHQKPPGPLDHAAPHPRPPPPPPPPPPGGGGSRSRRASRSGRRNGRRRAGRAACAKALPPPASPPSRARRPSCSPASEPSDARLRGPPLRAAPRAPSRSA